MYACVDSKGRVVFEGDELLCQLVWERSKGTLRIICLEDDD